MKAGLLGRFRALVFGPSKPSPERSLAPRSPRPDDFLRPGHSGGSRRTDVPVRPGLGLTSKPLRPGLDAWREHVRCLLEPPREPLEFWHTQDWKDDIRPLVASFDQVEGLPKAACSDAQLVGRGCTPEQLMQAVADTLLWSDGRGVLGWPGRTCSTPATLLKTLASRIMFRLDAQAQSDLRGLISRHAELLQERLQAGFALRLEDDVALLRRMLEAHPQLSIEEARGCLDQPHLRRSYVQRFVAPRLGFSRVVDRLGDAPNLLLVLALIDLMLRAHVGASYDWVVEQLKREHPSVELTWPGFSASDLANLKICYPMIPTWPIHAGSRERRKDLTAPNVEDLPEATAALIREVSLLPWSSHLLRRQHELRNEGAILADHELVSVELAANDVVGYLDHLIRDLGARGQDTTIIWKTYGDDAAHPVDGVIPAIAERVFGIRGVTPGEANELPRTVEAALVSAKERAAKDGRPLAAHLLGVQDWSGIVEQLRRCSPLTTKIIAHTSSDDDALASTAPAHLCLINLADAEAKHQYERLMLGDGIAYAFIEVERALNVDLRQRPFLVHGMGRTVGPALLCALEQLGVPPSNVFIHDPALFRAQPKPSESLLSLGAIVQRGFHVIRDPKRLPALFRLPLVSINATANHVLTEAMLKNVSSQAPLIHLQLGSNQKDVQLVRALSHSPDIGSVVRQLKAPIGRQVIAQYGLVGDDGRPSGRVVILPGDGKVLNHAFRRPIPTERTDFINLLKVESWAQAAWNCRHGRLGPRRLHSVQVTFDPEHRGRQAMVALLPLDGSVQAVSKDTLRMLTDHVPRHEPLALALVQSER